MSLRGRVIVLAGLVLLVSLALYVAVAWDGARRDLAVELGAARTGGVQTVRSTLEDVARSDHPARDLRQLVQTFDGNRHLRATFLGRDGDIRAASAVALPTQPAPRWFAASLDPAHDRVTLPVPDGSGARIALQPEPASDIATLWIAGRNAVGLFAVTATVALALIYWVIGRALAPLADLSRGLGAIGADRHPARLREEGPPELLALQRGFNAMAVRLDEIDARNRALEAQLLTIQDEERADIARDLHDEIGPHLFAVALDAELIARALKDGRSDEVAEQVRSIQQAVSYMQREVRDLIARLRPTRAAELGLEAALDDLVAFWRSRQPDVLFETALGGADDFVPEPLRDVIYRIVQEAVANALRHADTSRVTIAVARTAHGITTDVANCGATKMAMTQDAPGLGLTSMRERVQAAGGTLRIAPSGDGWAIHACFAPAVEERRR